MRLNRFDRTLLLGLALVLVAACFFASGCATQEQFMAGAASTRIGYVDQGGSQDFRGGKDSNDNQQYGTIISFEPFAWWGYNLQAQMLARAMTEAQYAARALPDPKLPTVQDILDRLGLPPKLPVLPVAPVKAEEKPR